MLRHSFSYYGHYSTMKIFLRQKYDMSAGHFYSHKKNRTISQFWIHRSIKLLFDQKNYIRFSNNHEDFPSKGQKMTDEGELTLQVVTFYRKLCWWCQILIGKLNRSIPRGSAIIQDPRVDIVPISRTISVPNNLSQWIQCPLFYYFDQKIQNFPSNKFLR